ncbi:amidohydrolase family protein [Arthrobacter castelli]|uniref:amidohydrolase family protein n=1 Tax=Arthrobacter castelli TaxID=271431 RepID=UPI0003FF440D|nr:amidohydrolase family protein [Arthrobacter castelli]
MGERLHIKGHILTGPDEVLGQMWVDDGRITFTKPAGGDFRTLEGWVLPGFVDAHCHIGLDHRGLVPDEVAEEQALTDRNAGTLLARDAGVVNDTRWVQHREHLPRLIRAGRHIARSRRYFRNFAVEVEPDELVAAVREQARAGDGWVKLVGDWIERTEGDLTPSFPAEAVKRAVAAAHEEGARVTAHCFSEQSLDDMLDADIDCIEHATGMRHRHIDRFVEQDLPIVPTLINIDTFDDIAGSAEAKYPTYAAHMRDMHRRRHDTIAKAYEAGVRIFAGTDAGSSIAHGRIADELAELTRASLPAAAALDAATWSARRWLGAEAISEGASADVVICSGDPRADIRHAGSLKHVVLRGNVVR